MQKTSARLLGRQELAKNVYHYDFEFVGEPINYKAGQFFMVHVKDEEGECTRAYSLASGSSETGFAMCVKLLESGRGSDFFRSKDLGDVLEFSGPFGHFVMKNPEEEMVFVATSTGIAPFMGFLPELFEEGLKKPLHLFFGVRHEEDFLYKEQLAAWAAEQDLFDVTFVLSKPGSDWSGEEGYVQDHVKGYDFGDGTRFYVCGNGQMVVDVRKMLMEERGVEKTMIQFEQFSPPKKV